MVSHSGVDIDEKKDPIGAIKLLLNASSGCGSKARAWNWADDAEILVSHFFPKKLNVFKEALGFGRYPNISEAIKIIDEFEKI